MQKRAKIILAFVIIFLALAGITKAATILTTDSGDTLDTFRTNVNTSLTNLNTALHGAVTLSGSRDYITLSGQDIVRGVIDISDDTNLATSSPITLTGDTLGFDFSTNNTWTGTQDFQAITTNAITPNADSTHDLGTAGIRWSNGYFDNIDATTGTIGTLSVSGATSGDFEIGGDLFVSGGDFELGDGSASSTLSFDGTNLSIDQTTIFTQGLISQASSTIDSLTTNTSTTTTLVLGSDKFTSLTGTGLSVSGGTLNAEVQSSDLHDAVTLSGTPDYITLSGQDIVRGTIDIGDDTNLSAGTNITLTGDQIDVDDAFLVNNANDTTTGTLTANSFELGDGDYIGIGSASERIQFDTAGDIEILGGNVGIGTTTPGAKLDVEGGIEMNQNQEIAAFNTSRTSRGFIELYNGATGNLTIDTTFSGAGVILQPTGGNVGIGTTDPQTALSIDSSHSADAFALFNTADVDTNFERLNIDYESDVARVWTEFAGAGTGSRKLELGVATLAGQTSPTRVLSIQSATPFFSYDFGGTGLSGAVMEVGGGGSWVASSNRQIGLEVNPTANQSGTASYTGLQIDVTETATGSGDNYLFDAQVDGSSKAVITSAGDVGIGETTPLAPLHITKDQAALTELRIDNSNVSGSVALTMFDGSNQRGEVHYDTAAALLTVGTNINTGQIRFNTGTDTEALRIDENGNLSMDGGSTTISAAELNRLDGIDAALVDLDDSPSWTGAHDFGGATSFELPNGTGLTVNEAGEITIDTTSGQLRYHDGTAERVVTYEDDFGFAIKSDNASTTATTTIPLKTFKRATTITDYECYSLAGTFGIQFTDGTNAMDFIIASTTAAEDDGTIANNSLTAREKWEVDIGTVSDGFTYGACSVTYTTNAD